MATILAIESSCDETAVAIIRDGKLLSKTRVSGSDEAQINVSSWAPGVYLIKVNAKPFKIIKK